MSTHSPSEIQSGLSDVDAQMHAETGFEVDENVAPLRFSGIVAMILGLISPAAMVGPAALIIPLIGILFGLFAVRPAIQKVSGVLPAKIGLVLCVGFGICGFFIPWLKSDTLGKQAVYFSRQYIELVAENQDEVALELKKNAPNRFAASMPLKQYYESSEESKKALTEFHDDSVNRMIRQHGPDANWELDKVRVYHQFRIDRAEVVWREPGTDKKIQFFMQYIVDPDNVGQWHVHIVQQHRELIVAETIL